MITYSAIQRKNQEVCNDMLSAWFQGHFNPSIGREKAISNAQQYFKQDAVLDFSYLDAKSDVFKIYIGPQGLVDYCAVTEKFEYLNFRAIFAQTSSDDVIYSKNSWDSMLFKPSKMTEEQGLCLMQEFILENNKIKYTKVYWNDAAHVMDRMIVTAEK